MPLGKVRAGTSEYSKSPSATTYQQLRKTARARVSQQWDDGRHLRTCRPLAGPPPEGQSYGPAARPRVRQRGPDPR